MNSQMVLAMGQEALWMLLMVSSPVLGVVPVSYTHLDVYKRQGRGGGGQRQVWYSAD